MLSAAFSLGLYQSILKKELLLSPLLKTGLCHLFVTLLIYSSVGWSYHLQLGGHWGLIGLGILGLGLGVPARMMGNIGNSLAMAAGATLLKGVGSYYRMLDTAGAPQEIQSQTTQRELITLGITGITSFATQLMAPALEKILNIKPQGKSGLLRTGLVFVGYVLAETIGRMFTKATYNDMVKHLQQPASSADRLLHQLTQFLWGQPAAQTNAVFSGHWPTPSFNPANFGRTANTLNPTVSPTFYSSHPHPNAFSSVSYSA